MTRALDEIISIFKSDLSYIIKRPSKSVARYKMIRHNHNDNQKGINKADKLKDWKNRWQKGTDGLPVSLDN